MDERVYIEKDTKTIIFLSAVKMKLTLTQCSYSIYKLGLLLIFLSAQNVWFLWNLEIYILSLVFLVTIFFVLSLRSLKSYFELKDISILSLLILFIIQFYIIRDSLSLSKLFATLFQLGIVSTILLLKGDRKIEILNFLVKCLAILLGISLFFWFFFLLGFNFLPHKTLIFRDELYAFDNYYFYLYDALSISNLIFPRFNSVFLEPGQLGMIASFILCIYKFNLKNKYILVIFIATLFTLSLAAYILMFLSFLLLKFYASRHRIRFIIILTTIIIGGIVVIQNYNEGDNPVNYLIFNRLEVDEDGDIVGNNRFSGSLESYYDSFIKTDKKYFGLGNVTYLNLFWEGGNAGYKVFILQYGFVGVFLVFSLYFSIFIRNRSVSGVILFVVYLVCFIQATYPLWTSVLMLFIIGIPMLCLNDKPKKKNVESSLSYK
ncbi:hypothetical protein [Dysgonomonas capnocytophagoides]|uniref:hypothetical protein n=1 Tax=Dysgonomonas capnocytophagoides TaxID=45254 RepID=UPI0033426F2D